MSDDDYLTLPLDPEAVAKLATSGLRFAPVTTANRDEFETWFQSMARGFLGERANNETIEARLTSFADRRMAGVYDDTADAASGPVATISSWTTDLTVPGHTSVPAWAISTVTVSPTHRRRGIANNLLLAELRTAAALKVPVAILTASEAVIYQRFGFEPSAQIALWTLQARRLSWNGPTPSGRVHFVDNNELRDGVGPDLLERVRLRLPGQTRFWGILWSRLFEAPGSDDAKHKRVVRYDDADGTPQGFAIYKIKEHDDHTNELQLSYIVAATPDAYAGLWKFLIEMDLVDSITADVRPIVEPVQWMVNDPRALRKTEEGDHLWVRVLDVKAALEGRRYSAAGTIALEVSDPLGYASGSWLLTVDADGVGTVSAVESVPDGAASLSLSVNELGALYLGGTSAATLVAAGRVVEKTDGAAEAFDRAFRSPIPPSLNIWF